MIKKIIYRLILAVFFIGITAKSFACSCAPSENAQEEYAAVDIVFIGKVIAVKDVEDYQQLITFTVSQNYKNINQNTIDVLTNIPGPSCGIVFDKGEEYLVYGYFSEETIRSNSCTLTKKLSDAVEDLTQLNLLSEVISNQSPSLCQQVGGKIAMIDECDGSQSAWCKISDKE